MPLPTMLAPMIRRSTAMIVELSRSIQTLTPSRMSFDFDPRRKKVATGTTMPMDAMAMNTASAITCSS